MNALMTKTQKGLCCFPSSGIETEAIFILLTTTVFFSTAVLESISPLSSPESTGPA
jgi:hypothetical protein